MQYATRRIAVQVFTHPSTSKLTIQHCRQTLPSQTVAAAFEPTSRALALLCRRNDALLLGCYVFDAEFQRLSKAAEIALEAPAGSVAAEDGTLLPGVQMPCILLPQMAASGDEAQFADKVR